MNLQGSQLKFQFFLPLDIYPMVLFIIILIGYVKFVPLLGFLLIK